jgi:O-antigen/teichoic acid export membrane protein
MEGHGSPAAETSPVTATARAAMTIRGALVMAFVNRYAVLAVNFAAMMLLARLLTPAQTGLFSVAASIVLLAQSIRDFGIAEFLVQEKDLTSAKIRTAFGMTLVLSWTLGAAIFASRNWIAAGYRTPELGELIGIVACSFAVAPFSSTVLALLNRDMAFGVLFRISVASNIMNSVVSITFAYLGWGAMALTLGMLAGNVTTAVVAALSARSWDHYIPSLREWRTLASFGAYMSGASIVNQMGGRAPDLIIGRLLGYQALGLYNRASGIVALFYDLVVSSVQAVAFPGFSRAYRAGEDLRGQYLRTATLISGAVLPVLAMLAILAQPLVRFLLGDQWLVAAALVPLLCIGTGMEAIAPMVTPFLSATGAVRMVLPIALYTRIAQIVMIGCLANFSITWIAAGQIGLGCVGLCVNARYLRRCAGVRITDLLSAARPSVMVAGLTVVLPLAGLLALRNAGVASPWLTMMVGGALAGIGWIGSIFALGHPLRREVLTIGHEMVRIVRRAI